MKTEEGNRIIAEFMGFALTDTAMGKVYMKLPAHIEDEGEMIFLEKPIFPMSLPSPDKMQYHTSWDWLMPVVEKICRMESQSLDLDTNYDNYLRTFGMIKDDTKDIMVRFNRMRLHTAPTLIEATYSAVLEFINWYNTQQNEKAK